jgi:flagellar protein FlbT
MALQIDLKPLQQITLGPVASVITNSDRRATLYISGDVPVLRDKDFMHEEDANTPCKRIYFLIQCMYLSPDPKIYLDSYFAQIDDILHADSTTQTHFLKINELIQGGVYYKAMKTARELIKHEENLMRHA